jgi:hypothetical protein
MKKSQKFKSTAHLKRRGRGKLRKSTSTAAHRPQDSSSPLTRAASPRTRGQPPRARRAAGASSRSTTTGSRLQARRCFPAACSSAAASPLWTCFLALVGGGGLLAVPCSAASPDASSSAAEAAFPILRACAAATLLAQLLPVPWFHRVIMCGEGAPVMG